MTADKGMRLKTDSQEFAELQRRPLLSKLRNNLTREQVLERLRYEPETGHFYWVKTHSHRVGKRAGTVSTKAGYRMLHIGGCPHREHRIAWLVMTGEWPTGLVDHINRNTADNRWCNLRLATQSQQTLNTSLRSDNKSGVRGVKWCKRRKKWQADYRCRFIGYYSSKEEARAAYLRAAAESGDEKFIGEVDR